jgi:hypothetical protein
LSGRLVFSYLLSIQECVADALPRATYQWFKNDQPLAPDTAGILQVTDETSSHLDFHSPGQDHAGLYTQPQYGTVYFKISVADPSQFAGSGILPFGSTCGSG